MKPTVIEDKRLTVIVMSGATNAKDRSSVENATGARLVRRWMQRSWLYVEVSQNVMVSQVEYAMNFPCCGRAMHETELTPGTDHSETVDPIDASICSILLVDVTKI